MASRYSKIQSSIWTSDKFNQAKEFSKIVYMYLLSCPHGNSAGFYRLPEGYATTDLKCTQQRYRTALDDLKDVGLISQEEDIIFVHQFLRFNPYMNPSHAKGSQTEIAEYESLEIYTGFYNDVMTYCNDYLEYFNSPAETGAALCRHGVDTMTLPKPRPITKTNNQDQENIPENISLGEFQKVSMTQKQYDTLCDKYGQAIVDDKVASLDAQIQSKVKKYLGYKDHYATIGNWCRADKEKARASPQHGYKERPTENYDHLAIDPFK